MLSDLVHVQPAVLKTHLTTHLLKILRVSMMSLKLVKFSMRHRKRTLVAVEMVSGPRDTRGCPLVLSPSGMSSGGSCRPGASCQQAKLGVDLAALPRLEH